MGLQSTLPPPYSSFSEQQELWQPEHPPLHPQEDLPCLRRRTPLTVITTTNMIAMAAII